MVHSEIMQKIEDLSEERERLLAREGSHHVTEPLLVHPSRGL
jgi:hypothetical protein